MSSWRRVEFLVLMLMMTTQSSQSQGTFFEHVDESTCSRGHMSSCGRVESFLVFDDDDDEDDEDDDPVV